MDYSVKKSAHASVQHAHSNFFNFSIIVDPISGVSFGFISKAEGQILQLEIAAIVNTLRGFEVHVHDLSCLF